MNTQEINPRKPDVILVNSDDWTGLYIDGLLVKENHLLYARDVLKILAELGVIDFLPKVCDAEWLEEAGELPSHLSEVRFKE